MQDTFVRAASKLNTFQGGEEKGWLVRIARNITIDYIRKRKPVAYLFDRPVNIETMAKTPEQLSVLNETEKELYQALQKLRISYREVIILRKIKEFSIKESASILNWSESKVKVQLMRALEALKKELQKEGYIHEPLR
ncbi:RNA polymerase sigma-70 factor, ECF subfamily [Gracilibacillus ureilyticus]|uniref:RNA polymerase sigma-70 factor, ECF subfamily n=1 Tax=Gracilibacillus ureilyticus TaxID=531814 RepID=A0A1H9QVQ3_9BACI|nr:RNA polymerase sigma factor [Gracilibacillus ureilyticus]SER63919.1 RNA polymerase sigma-70 factor, ECF subfamily [Gracilibacillus ureilyticus]